VTAAVPSGASTGTLEAIELRDGGERLMGKGVLKAVENINEHLRPKVIGHDCTSQSEIDHMMIDLDGTENKGKLGANAILGISLAVARAGAMVSGQPLYEYLGKLSGRNSTRLPIPVFNVINGGAHAGNKLDFQEYMMIPSGAASFQEAMQIGVESYHALKARLKKSYGPDAINIGDEGGFAPPLAEYDEPLKLILDTVTEIGYGDKVKLGMDVAASEFYKDGKYIVNGKPHSTAELLDVYKELVANYPIVSLEDPFDEQDWDGFVAITKELGNKIQLVGDDLFVTNMDRLKSGIDKGACNCLLLKVNQIGTVTESINAALLAFENGYGTMVSHRSGETEDPFIADLVVGLDTGQIKSGAPARSDRTSKYNQLLRIEEKLGGKSTYGQVKYLSG